METNQPDAKGNVYLIPGKVQTRTEIFPGIGWKELGIIAAAAGFGFLVFLLLGIPQQLQQTDEIIPSVSAMATPAPPGKVPFAPPATDLPKGIVQAYELDTADPEPTSQITSVPEPMDKQPRETQSGINKMVSVIPAPLRLMIVLLFGGIAFVLVQRGNGPSILEMIIRTYLFGKSRKRYLYKSEGC